MNNEVKIPVFNEPVEEFAYYAVTNPICSTKVLKIAITASANADVREAGLRSPLVTINMLWEFYEHKSMKKYPKLLALIKDLLKTASGVNSHADESKEA